MRMSHDRILTSHVGSLPRAPDLLDLREKAETKGELDDSIVEARITRAISDIVAQQREAGVDIVNDGENCRTPYNLYVQDRLNGVGPVPPETERPKTAQHADLMAHPAGFLVEGANPAHANEFEDLKRLGLPDDKVLLPGVTASTDCGFATFAGPNNPVAPTVVWSKLRALSNSAALASEQLWSPG